MSSKAVLTDAEQKEFENIKARIKRICQSASDNKVPLMIDAEETWIQDAVDDIVTEMMKQYNKQWPCIYNTLQMYRWDRLDFLKNAHKKAVKDGYYLAIKFVRGAYMEKERERALLKGYRSPIHDDKEGTDKDFDLALTYCIENISNIAVFSGTHNEQSSLHLTELMKLHNVSKSHPYVWFSQLFGMSDHISYNLAKAGYNVIKYVPYGPVNEVLPYLIRRAEENTSVAGQTGRELKLILQ